MNNEVFEEVQGAEGGAKAKLEKQARQLAYDTKYKVKQAMSANKGGKLDPAAVRRAYLSQLAKSPAPPAVKALARKKLLGEEYINAEELANTSMINAMVKVFHEGISTEEPEQIEEESSSSDKKFYVKVTDKKTGNTYRRWATRSKMSELRSNPNIASVEMTKYGEHDEKERTKGAQTAAVKSGKGLDPVGKEDNDPDNDGVPISRDKNDQYIMKRRKAIGNAISSRKSEKVTESFLSDWRNELFEKNDEKNDNKKLDVMKGENKIIVSPEISEKLNLASADMGDVIKDFRASDAPQFKGKSNKKRKQMAIAAKLTAERGDEKLGEDCGCDDTEKKGDNVDAREMKTKANLVKNKFRSMGLKMSYDPEGEVIDESEIGDRARRVVGDQRQGVHGFSDAVNKDQKAIKQNLLKLRPYGAKGFPSANTGTKKTTQVAHYELEGDQLDENPMVGLGIKAGLAAGTALAGKAVFDKAKGVAGKLKERNKKTEDAMKQLRQSYDPEGKVIEQVTTQTQLKPLPSSGSTGYNKPPAAPTLPPPSAAKTPKKPAAKQTHNPNPMGYAIRGNTFRVEDSQINGEVIEERNPEVEKRGKEVAGYEKAGKYQGISSKFRNEHPGSRQKPKVRGGKPTEGEVTQSRIRFHNRRVAKYGFTEREKRESKARERYDTPRD